MNASAGARPPGVRTFGVLPDGRAVHAVRLASAGVAVELLTLGATIHRLEVDGRNIALGHPGVADYLASKFFVGQTVGRFANRIAAGRFVLDGVGYELPRNNGVNTLHGGPDGFFRRLWEVGERGDSFVELWLTSPDGDQGFPGELRASARFSVAPGELRVVYSATSDAPTPVNLTNHAYLNPDGEDSGACDGQWLQVNAGSVTEVDAGLIPTGRLVPAGALDLRTPRRVADVGPLDHNFAIDPDAPTLAGEPGLRHHATLTGRSGLAVDVYSDRPGLQVFTADAMDADIPATSGGGYVPRAGVALETQDFPDAPNQPGFPDTILRPGRTYRAETVWRFRRV